MEQSANLLAAAFSHWSVKRAARMGAAVAYYAMFSLVPMIVILIILASTIFSHQVVVENINLHLSAAIGAGLSRYLLALAGEFTPSNFNVFGAVASVIVLMIAALGVIGEVSKDLRELWELDSKEAMTSEPFPHRIKGYLSSQLRFATVLISVALAVTFSIALGVIGSPLVSNLSTITLGIALCMILYRTLSGVALPFRELFLGATLTTAMFHIGKLLITLYLAHTSSLGVFGAAGSVLAIAVWVFYSSQVFFLSASWMYVRFVRNKRLSTSESPL